MSERSFAGFRYAEHVRDAAYGAVYRGHNAAGTEVWILDVTPELSGAPGFADALTRYGTELGLLQHRNVVSTVSVGRNGGALVVVTAPAHSVSLAALLEDTDPQGLPSEMALAVIDGVLRALEGAHALNIVHGALHPRSIYVTEQGQVYVADFAVARALATAAAKGTKLPLFKALRGFVSPEQARGKEPSPQSDVYSAGSVLFTMLAGEAPPAKLKTTRSLGRVLNRALDSDLNKRFQYAKAMRLALSQLTDSGAAKAASPAQLGEFVREVHAISGGAAAPAPDVDLDDLLSSLAEPDDPDELTDEPTAVAEEPEEDPTNVAAEPEQEQPVARASEPDEEPTHVAGMRAAHMTKRGMGSSHLEPASAGALPAAPGAVEAPDLDALLADLEDERPRLPPEFEDSATLDGDQPTRVDETPMNGIARDPISELIELDKQGRPLREGRGASLPPEDFDEATPLPMPLAAHEVPGSFTRSGPEILEGTGQKHKVAAAAAAAIAALEEEEDDVDAPAVVDDAPSPSPARSRPRIDSEPPPELQAMMQSRGILPGWAWLAVTALVLGGLFWVVWTKTDVFHPERAKAKKEAAERKRRAAINKFQASQPQAGAIEISSEPDGAAVWLKLGRAPLDSMVVKASVLHELRVEHDGYMPKDVRVTGAMWSGKGRGMRAAVNVELAPGKPDKPVPAAPPEPPKTATGSLRAGEGVIHVDTRPAGAEVWLLIGFTHDFRPFSTLAGKEYELKVLKDGHRPAYVSIREADWKRPSGELKRRITRALKLDKLAGK